MFDTLPAGKYFFGDPSFVCSNQVYHYYWGEIYKYEPGLHTILDKPFWIFPAICGDGIYKDNEKHTYLVDSGMIGLVSMDLCNLPSEEEFSDYQIFDLESGVVFHHLNGVFELISSDTHIVLNTQKKSGLLPKTSESDIIICSDTELEEDDDDNDNASIDDFNEDMIEAQYDKKVKFMDYVNESEDQVYQKSLEAENNSKNNINKTNDSESDDDESSEEDDESDSEEQVQEQTTKQFFKPRR